MSSSSKSATSSTVNQADNRNVLGEGSINAQTGSIVTVQSLDGEVINSVSKGAFGFGENALNQSFDFGKNALDMADISNKRAIENVANSYQDAMLISQNVLDKSFSNLQSSQEMVATAYQDAKGRGAMTDKMMMGAIAAVALIGFAAIRSQK